jgi:hypothetical protein
MTRQDVTFTIPSLPTSKRIKGPTNPPVAALVRRSINRATAVAFRRPTNEGQLIKRGPDLVPGSTTTTITTTEAMIFQNVASAISTDNYSNARCTVPANGTRLLLRDEKGPRYVVHWDGKGCTGTSQSRKLLSERGAPVLYVVGSNVIGWTVHS